jgi:uncharacterized phage-associated protein
MRLLKLLYIADRESLRETGRPITGGPVIALERGPALKEVYDLILGQHREMSLWSQFYRKERYDLLELAEPDVGQLSKYEIAKLQEVAKTYQDDDEWALVDITHRFPGWSRNDPGESSRPIPVSDILEAIGHTGAIDEISKEALSLAAFDRLLGR